MVQLIIAIALLIIIVELLERFVAWRAEQSFDASQRREPEQ